MKTLRNYFSILLFASACLVACDGPEGPQGPAGENGENGLNAAESCTECHDNSEVIKARQVQYFASVHYTGGNYERNSTSCAPCHTSQGFRERIEAGTQTTTATIENPAPPNCYTCHDLHNSYTTEDWQLRVEDPVTFWNQGGTHDFGTANLCAECHQSRVVSPMPEVGGADVNITSSRWGPHHGPQGNLLAGIGGYEVAGSQEYKNSSHTNGVTNACVTCHMADAYGSQAGGHQFGVAYDYHGTIELNTAGCLSSGCHSDEDALVALTEEKQVEIETLLGELKTLLIAAGIYNEANNLAKTGTFPANVAGAYLNFITIEEDRSHGIHNFYYTKALLTNSIESLQ